MLGAKTTVKDRWRQIWNEARRVEHKHLLTLREGVRPNSSRRWGRRSNAVVPKPLHHHYPEAVIPKLLSVSEFISETKTVCGDS
jgi:hypothetical protein